MVAVAPSAPKPQVAQGSRTAKPAAGGAGFDRLLEKAAGENRPAPEAEPRAPEAEPGTTDRPGDQAPAQTGEKKAADRPGDQAPAQTGEKKAAAQDQEQEPQPERAKSPDAAPAPAAPQHFVPLPATEAAKTAAPQTQVTAAAGAALAAADKAAILATPAPANGNPPRGKAASLTPPVPGAGVQPAPPAAGKTEGSHSRAEGEKAATPAADQPPADQQLDLENLQPKAAERAPEKNSSADLLNFGELLRPDLRTEVSPEPVLDQLQQAVNAALLDESLVLPQVVRGLATLVSEGMSEMRLQLQPEDLGEIELRVRAGEGAVRGEMMVQNPEVKQLLDQHLDRLRNALHQQGLDLRGFDVGLAPDGRFAQPDRSGHGFQPRGGTRRQAPAASALPEAPALAPRGSLAVDYLA